MNEIKTLTKSKLDKIKNNPESSGLAYKLYGRSKNILDYTDKEISEMAFGIYLHKKTLLVDGDYFICLNDVIKIECELHDVSYIQKPTLETWKDNSCNAISNIRTFYIKDYFLITNNNKDPNFNRHKITRYLTRIGFLRHGRGKFRGYFSISNDYKTIQNGLFPKDLYHPIKRYINGLFFYDDYKISDFEVVSSIKFIAQ